MTLIIEVIEMAGNRKAAEAVIIGMMTDLDPTGTNASFLKNRFAHMSDKEFDQYMVAIEQGNDFVSLIRPTLQKHKVDTDHNLAVAKKWGYDFFHRLWLTDKVTGLTYLTKHKYLCLHMPVRRQIQTLKNKMSVPEDNKHVDDLTDQPTGPSKGSSISFPELLGLRAQGLDKCPEEFVKFRGGDLTAMNAMDKMIHETGGAAMATFYPLNSRAKATIVYSTFLKAMHLDNNA